jgi:putative flavoprotein involved in K+ transport
VRVDDVVIVGAGPAGLAAAATLRRRGIDATIIERGRMGEPWRGRYDRLHLHTIRSLSHLPGYRIPREFGRWVARDQFVQYLEQYAAHHRLVPRLEVEATRIDRDDGHWSVRTTTGTIAARVVVVATGYTRLPHLPRWPGTFDGPVIHSVQYRNPQPYRDQDVLIVGAGNSGTEIAVDLAEGGARRVRIAVRTAPNILRRDVKGFPIQLLGIVFRRLPPRLLDQLILVLERATVPDLSACGLQRPGAPFSQFRHTGTVPIIDVGFIDAVRSGVIEVVPGGHRARRPGSRAHRWITRVSGRRCGGHRLPPWARAARRPSHSDRRARYSKPATPSAFHRNAHPNLRAVARGRA